MLAHNVGMATELPYILRGCYTRSMSANRTPTQVERLRRLLPMTLNQPRFLGAFFLFALVLQQARRTSSSV
jgi:hypothetical protein